MTDPTDELERQPGDNPLYYEIGRFIGVLLHIIFVWPVKLVIGFFVHIDMITHAFFLLTLASTVLFLLYLWMQT